MIAVAGPRSARSAARLLFAGLVAAFLVSPPASVLGEGKAEPEDRVFAAIKEAAARRGTLQGDRLLELYVRRAAESAGGLPEKQRTSAFLAGLGRALVDPGIAAPTLRGRADLAKHFFVAAQLADTLGAQQADALGLAKEQYDMAFGSGFSFADLLANSAGIALQARLAKGEVSLDELARRFRAADYLPDPRVLRLEDGLSSAQFRARYGSVTDPRFRKRLADIRAQVESLWKERAKKTTAP